MFHCFLMILTLSVYVRLKTKAKHYLELGSEVAFLVLFMVFGLLAYDVGRFWEEAIGFVVMFIAMFVIFAHIVYYVLTGVKSCREHLKGKKYQAAVQPVESPLNDYGLIFVRPRRKDRPNQEDNQNEINDCTFQK